MGRTKDEMFLINAEIEATSKLRGDFGRILPELLDEPSRLLEPKVLEMVEFSVLDWEDHLMDPETWSLRDVSFGKEAFPHWGAVVRFLYDGGYRDMSATEASEVGDVEGFRILILHYDKTYTTKDGQTFWTFVPYLLKRFLDASDKYTNLFDYQVARVIAQAYETHGGGELSHLYKEELARR
jgi:hypothetical protein